MFPVMRVHSKEKEKEDKEGARILIAWVNENNNNDLTNDVRFRSHRTNKSLF